MKNNKEYYGHFVCLPVPQVKRSETAERKIEGTMYNVSQLYLPLERIRAELQRKQSSE